MNAKCKSCNLHLLRRNIVGLRGSFDADILFVTEAPSKSDVLRRQLLCGNNSKLLQNLFNDSGLYKNGIPWAITSILKCRPCDTFSGDTRDPHPEEVLACAKHFLYDAHKVNPKGVVFFGKLTAKYYKNEFPNSITLVHPSFVVRTGGVASPHYPSMVRLLEDFVDEIKEKK